MNYKKILEKEQFNCFKFFLDYSNNDEQSLGYGLTEDRSGKENKCSIAAVGFKLSALVVGVENNYLNYEEALKHYKGTLHTLYYNVDHYQGFFAHFVDLQTGKRIGKSEYSTIDTALCLNGILTCQTYFADEEANELAHKIIKRVNYRSLLFEHEGYPRFHMSINPDKDGDYAENADANGFIHQWDHYAEQMMMYMHLAFDDEISDEDVLAVYNGFRRDKAIVDGQEVIYSPGGSMFIYEFAHAWFDFANFVDVNGVDWFENSRRAIKANQNYCINDEFATHNEYVWGLSAGMTKDGYRVFGAPPVASIENMKAEQDGTVQQYAIVAALPFLLTEVQKSLEYLVRNYPELEMEYGFSDGMNFENETWICPEYLGIDKGITILMIDCYYKGSVMKSYMNNPLIKKAIKRLKFKEKNDKY